MMLLKLKQDKVIESNERRIRMITDKTKQAFQDVSKTIHYGFQ